MFKKIQEVYMPALLLFALIALSSFKLPDNTNEKHYYVYRQISTIESVVPGGMGRSRIITTDEDGQMRDKDLKNFFSLVGINFENISSNDHQIVERLNELSKDGWELFQVTSGANSQISNGSSSGGIFITRYLFRKLN